MLSPPPSPRQVQSFAQWLRDYPAKEKVVIAGHQGSEVQHHNVSQRDWTKEYHGFIRDSSGFIFKWDVTDITNYSNYMDDDIYI